jgi:hypothetical protein
MEYLVVVEGAGNLDTEANFIKTFVLNQYWTDVGMLEHVA